MTSNNILLDRRALIATTVGATVVAGGRSTASRAQQVAGTAITPRTTDDPIPVAFLIDNRATIIDFCGPWEAFQDTRGRFNLFTVAPDQALIQASGGMKIVPDYTLASAPPARIIVVGAQDGSRQVSPTTKVKVDWLRTRYQQTDVIISVCTGAFLLARTGLLDGLQATTHHDYQAEFQRDFPEVHLQQNRRYVDNGKIVTAGGLTSGIDAALHIISRYLGFDSTQRVADYMEYESRNWIEGVAG